jgi:hypothetical protein
MPQSDTFDSKNLSELSGESETKPFPIYNNPCANLTTNKEFDDFE